MSEQTGSTTTSVPARIELDDFIEAVTRGVTRALAAQEEVSGYALPLGGAAASTSASTLRLPTILIGIIASPSSTFDGLTDAMVAKR